MIYFTSDLHFFHANIIRFCDRPFSSVEEMNENMIKNWNETVAPDDIIYCLGDFSMAFRSVEVYTPRLNGYKILIPGNHDFCHNSHKRARREGLEKWTNKYKECGWNEVHLHHKIEYNGVTINLSHMPYAGDRFDERFTKWRLIDEGEWLLHGHVHEKFLKAGKQINVGVDQHQFRPISIDHIFNIMSYNGNLIGHFKEGIKL